MKYSCGKRHTKKQSFFNYHSFRQCRQRQKEYAQSIAAANAKDVYLMLIQGKGEGDVSQKVH